MIDARGAEDGVERTDAQAARRAITPWQKALLALAVVVGLAGLGLQVFGGSGGTGAGRRAESTGTAGPLTTGLVPQSQQGDTGEATAESAPATGAAAWSPLLVKGGFGFFAGFSIGYALRAFFKVSAIVVGVILLALVGLLQAGAVEIHWDQFSSLYDTAVAKLSEQFTSLRTALTGALPAAGFGGLGLFTGLKGRR